jgi:hypothetical protein
MLLQLVNVFCFAGESLAITRSWVNGSVLLVRAWPRAQSGNAPLSIYLGVLACG